MKIYTKIILIFSAFAVFNIAFAKDTEDSLGKYQTTDISSAIIKRCPAVIKTLKALDVIVDTDNSIHDEIYKVDNALWSLLNLSGEYWETDKAGKHLMPVKNISLSDVNRRAKDFCVVGDYILSNSH